MGITAASLERIARHDIQPCKLLIVGCQNLYNPGNYLQVAHEYYHAQGYDVRSWDILGCQGSEVVDLRTDLRLQPVFDCIMQHGTVEHVDGSLYQPLKNIHEGCKAGGIMIHENPKTGNWPGHGYHYFTETFFENLAEVCGYALLEATSEPAMGNAIDGWNICAVLRKADNKTFIAENQFNEIYAGHIFPK